MKNQTKSNKALVLRTCRADLTSSHNFQWPESGPVTCPDWKPSESCGHGLHGWIYGAGDHDASNFLGPDAKWLVVEVDLSEVIMLGGKCKFPRGIVKFAGDKKGATDYLIDNEPRAKDCEVIGALLTVGDNEAVIVGALGTATAGEGGTATAGEGGTATAGYKGTATAGYKGTATAGNWGTATAGEGGTATAGYKGTATAGEGGEIHIRYWDNKADRYRTKVGYIGEDSLKPDTAYCLDENNNFIEKAEAK